MAAYMHGNLAVKEKQAEQQRVAVRETKRTVSRPKALPAGEKLLLLMLVVVFVGMAGVVVSRYTQIYNINNQVAKMQASIHDIDTENSMLKQQLDKLGNPESLEKDAAQWGFVPASQDQTVTVQAKASQANNAQAKADPVKDAAAKTDKSKAEQTKTDASKTVQSKSSQSGSAMKEAAAVAAVPAKR